MINEEILSKLMPISDEEQAILDGDGSLDRSIYTTEDSNVISSKRLLSDGSLIKTRVHTRFVHFPEHTHDYIEAVYMCSGETTHIINGRPLTLKEGELILLGQGARQEILPAGLRDVAVNFIIKPSFFDKTLEMLGNEDTPIRSFILSLLFSKENQGYLHFKVAGVLPIQNLIENLLWSLIHKTESKRSTNQITMGLLFTELLNHTDKLAHESREDRAIMELLRYVEENYREASLSSAAERLHYDVFWLSHEIKNRTGKTYTEHLQEKRLSTAASLLKSTSLSVEEIALAVGYENKSYFHRIFSAKYGTTPKKYRRTI